MSTPRGWHVIQHVPFEGPGLIAAEGERRGVPPAVCRTYLGDPLPTLSDLDGLIVMGGPMSVHDLDAHPHLAGEVELLAACVNAEIPVLGVCLGCQLLAQALGGTVHQGPQPEIGPGSVALTHDGHCDPLMSAATTRRAGDAGATASDLDCDRLPVIHWHQDTFDLPPGAVRLAGSDLYENQAFRAGERAYGLQFHVEVDRGLAEEWAPRLPEGVEIGERARASIESAGRRAIAAFFDLAQHGR